MGRTSTREYTKVMKGSDRWSGSVSFSRHKYCIVSTTNVFISLFVTFQRYNILVIYVNPICRPHTALRYLLSLQPATRISVHRLSYSTGLCQTVYLCPHVCPWYSVSSLHPVSQKSTLIYCAYGELLHPPVSYTLTVEEISFQRMPVLFLNPVWAMLVLH